MIRLAGIIKERRHVTGDKYYFPLLIEGVRRRGPRRVFTTNREAERYGRRLVERANRLNVPLYGIKEEVRR